MIYKFCSNPVARQGKNTRNSIGSRQICCRVASPGSKSVEEGVESESAKLIASVIFLYYVTQGVKVKY